MLLGYVEYYDPRDPLAEPSQETAEAAASEKGALPKQEAAVRTRKFQRADRDGDGIVTPEELPQTRLFQRFDADRDGKLTLEEVLAR
jgi:Ca2+-binding EF-hand superfamily protein